MSKWQQTKFIPDVSDNVYTVQLCVLSISWQYTGKIDRILLLPDAVAQNLC